MKRLKVITTLTTSILCLGLLVFGVLSAIQVGFTFGGSLSFNPEGVYVDVEGQVYRGTDYNNLQPLTESEYSYASKNYTNSAGSPSGNFTMEEWSPSIIFLPTEKYLQYEVKITNKSSEPITALPSSFAAISGIEAVELSSDVLRIDPGETGTYELNLEYTGDQALTSQTFDVTFDIRTTSAFVEAQTGVTFTQSSGTITGVSGDNSTNSIESMRDTLFIPKTVDGTIITTYGSGSSISLSSNIKKVIFDANITSIGNSAFQNCSSLTSVTFGENSQLESIGYSAFYYCSSLTSIEIPSGVTSIGSNAFYGCSSLTSIEIPSGVTSIGVSTFFNCSSLTSIEIPNGVTSIDSSVFYGCSSLTSVEIPSGVTSIGSSAFSNCSSLTSIEIPSGVTSIGSSAFSGCTNIIKTEGGLQYLKATVDGVLNEYFAVLDTTSTSISTANINANCKIIAGSAFSFCSSLTSIEIPSGVTSIGSSAFYYCSKLTSIDMSKITNWGSLSLGSNSFKTNASSTPTTITVASGLLSGTTVTSKFTPSVIGSSMENKIKLTDGSTTYTWNGSDWTL